MVDFCLSIQRRVHRLEESAYSRRQYGPSVFPILSMPFNEDELYQEHILDHYEEPFHRGRCPHATHAHEDDNPLSGDVVRVDLEIDQDGKIADAYFDGDGCCISQAAASMLLERMNGRSVEEVKKFTAREMLELFGAKLSPNRQKCCLLTWRVLQAAVYSPLTKARDNTSVRG